VERQAPERGAQADLEGTTFSSGRLQHRMSAQLDSQPSDQPAGGRGPLGLCATLRPGAPPNAGAGEGVVR
jgi:hypothetical protein